MGSYIRGMLGSIVIIVATLVFVAWGVDSYFRDDQQMREFAREFVRGVAVLLAFLLGHAVGVHAPTDVAKHGWYYWMLSAAGVGVVVILAALVWTLKWPEPTLAKEALHGIVALFALHAGHHVSKAQGAGYANFGRGSR